MAIKTVLQKFFIQYGEKWASTPSYRGCCEKPVPVILQKRNSQKSPK